MFRGCSRYTTHHDTQKEKGFGLHKSTGNSVVRVVSWKEPKSMAILGPSFTVSSLPTLTYFEVLRSSSTIRRPQHVSLRDDEKKANCYFAFRSFFLLPGTFFVFFDLSRYLILLLQLVGGATVTFPTIVSEFLASVTAASWWKLALLSSCSVTFSALTE